MRSIETVERDSTPGSNLRAGAPRSMFASGQKPRILVQKYGGSSLATVDAIRAVAHKVVSARAEGFSLVVVVSAMGKTTDSLLDLARGVSDAPPAREVDMLLSSGERISTSLLAMAVQALGVPAVSLTGPQCGIRTDDAHASARIVSVDPTRVEREIAAGRVVVVAGFQGESPLREVTTLGRGGSDASAVALAAALRAERCDIFSDVDGVYTADPRVCSAAAHIACLGYEEMEALARHGAKVLNTHAVELARREGVTIHARSTFGGAGHTVVRAQGSGRHGVTGITGRGDLWRVTCRDAAATAAREAIDPCAVIASRVGPGHALEIVVTTQDLPEAASLLAALRSAGAVVDEELGSVTAVVVELGERQAVAREAPRVLGAAGIAVISAFTAGDALSWTMRAEHVGAAVCALHAAFCESSPARHGTSASDRRVA